MNYHFSLIGCLLFICTGLFGQIVSISPSNVTADDAATIVFDATEGNGELVGASKVYIHHGSITSGPSGTDWSNVIGNWGMDDGVGQMTKVSGESDQWQITMSPTIRQYFGVSSSQDIFRIAMVFRSADGNTKGTIAAGTYDWGTVADNLDMYFDIDVPAFVQITQPTANDILVDSGTSFEIAGTASQTADNMKVWIDEGNGFVEKKNQSNTASISYDYTPTASGAITIKISADINGNVVDQTKTLDVTVQTPTMTAPLPDGVRPGINYHPTDDTKATLVLEAPGKSSAYVVGDMNNWKVDDTYQMKQTADKEFFWIELDNLTAGQPYVFQYWVDGTIRIGDPYAELVVDPWNDQFIPSSVYPNIPTYDKTEDGVATVLETGQTPFIWDESEDSWTRPDPDHMVIYELLIRDFIATHDWDGLRDTLSYIKNLGVDAIEIMPFNEFEGNESWGYNPSYFLAPDKYYGTADDIKEFVQYAHQQGLAVIMDIVLNHAYDQNPMVQLYFNNSTNNPADDNPWFNANNVGPFDFGNDVNHESTYTHSMIDRINRHWIEEYHIDGYRFDFTKGFTQNAPGNSLDAYDQSRIDNIKRMADQLWAVDPNAYVILEHFAANSEEVELANYGAKLWSNRSYDYVPATLGNTSVGALTDMDRTSHVSYFSSHDERRIAEHLLTEGLSDGVYNTRLPEILYERTKLTAAFTFLIPGPKMMWQFDELGYDIDINLNGRVGNKPLPWGSGSLGYYDDPLRQHIYSTYQGLLEIRNKVGAEKLAAATTSHTLSGDVRVLNYNTSDIDMVVVGNFGLTANDANVTFSETGYWYDYFSGDSIMIDNVAWSEQLQPGEWHVYTTTRLGEGIPGAVEVFDNPVTITPETFTAGQAITITFDAQKAWKAGTAGLIGARKVYFHSGVVQDAPTSTTWGKIVGNLVDDGIGQMTNLGNDLWEINITPSDYYNLSNNESAFRLGMYFRNADNTALGKGFRDTNIYFDIASDDPYVKITPSDFDIDTQIKITFNALQGNRELVGANKVYMHSSMGLVDSEMPYDNAWNHVIGNWGQDDGVGQMSKVAGKDDQWEIALIPRGYYGLSDGDFPYWLAAVFRSADGNIKGTEHTGSLENGFVHTNQDVFIRNDRSVGTNTGLRSDQDITIYPNPATSAINLLFDNIEGSATIQVIDMSGRQLSHYSSVQMANRSITIPLEDILPGLYVVRIMGEGFVATRLIIKQ